MNFLFHLIYGLYKLIERLPFRILYFFSSIFYLIIFYIFPYRKKVVRKNLENSFPFKSEKEIDQILKKFYHNFCELFTESIKVKKIIKLQRIKICNRELLDEYFKQNKSVIIMMAHVGNWEWVCGTFQRFFPDFKCAVSAHPQSNPIFNRFLMTERNKYIEVVNTKYIIKSMFKNKGIPSAYLLIADQRPPMNEEEYWTTFLNQDTPFFTGAEKIARTFDFPVLFLNAKRIKRGYFEIYFSVIADQPKATKEFEITENYARQLEQAIIAQPDNWLWSHNRWKHSKSQLKTPETTNA